LLALVRLERLEHVAEEELPLRRDALDDPLTLGREPDDDRAAVVHRAAPLGNSQLLEPVDEPCRGRVVDADPGGELADAQAPVLGQEVERAQLARRQLDAEAGMERGVQAPAGQDGRELTPALGELRGKGIECASRDICTLQKSRVAALIKLHRIPNNLLTESRLRWTS
jgi:hypothetical protein